MLMQLKIFSSSAGEVFRLHTSNYTDLQQHHSCCLLTRRSHDDVNFVLVFQSCVCLPGSLVGVDKTVWRESICFQGNSCLENIFCFLVWKSLHLIGFYISSALKGLIGFVGLLCKLLFLSTSVQEELLIIIPMVKSMNRIWSWKQNLSG
jgi:hypothetical protein